MSSAGGGRIEARLEKRSETRGDVGGSEGGLRPGDVGYTVSASMDLAVDAVEAGLDFGASNASDRGVSVSNCGTPKRDHPNLPSAGLFQNLALN
jgi:hypothetical protein